MELRQNILDHLAFTLLILHFALAIFSLWLPSWEQPL